jgi:hypothetical protein
MNYKFGENGIMNTSPHDMHVKGGITFEKCPYSMVRCDQADGEIQENLMRAYNMKAKELYKENARLNNI